MNLNIPVTPNELHAPRIRCNSEIGFNHVRRDIRAEPKHEVGGTTGLFHVRVSDTEGAAAAQDNGGNAGCRQPEFAAGAFEILLYP